MEAKNQVTGSLGKDSKRINQQKTTPVLVLRWFSLKNFPLKVRDSLSPKQAFELSLSRFRKTFWYYRQRTSNFR